MIRTTTIVPLLLFTTLARTQHRVMKINLSSVTLQNTYLSYEQVLGKKTSFNLGLNYLFDRYIPFHNQFEDIKGNENPLKEMKMHGFGITPEFRFYTHPDNVSPNGFYVAPYLRFNQLLFQCNDYPYHYTDIYDQDTPKTASVDYKGSITSIGGGVMIGHQWIFGNHFSVDLWIIGLGISDSNFKLKASSDDLNQRYFKEGTSFSNDVNDYLKILNEPTLDAGNHSLQTNSERMLPSLRGLGLNVGVAF